jgi:Mrp family chromosome partitioning ATPase
MAALIQHFACSYDHVIIDSPCLSAVDDPRLLSKSADGLVLVVRPELLDVKDVATAKEQLRQLESKVLGLVVNGVEPEREYRNLTHKDNAPKDHVPNSPEKPNVGSEQPMMAKTPTA